MSLLVLIALVVARDERVRRQEKSAGTAGWIGDDLTGSRADAVD
jgi:hypothetical protein